VTYTLLPVKSYVVDLQICQLDRISKTLKTDYTRFKELVNLIVLKDRAETYNFCINKMDVIVEEVSLNFNTIKEELLKLTEHMPHMKSQLNGSGNKFVSELKAIYTLPVELQLLEKYRDLNS
jgi:hypothetical protein